MELISYGSISKEFKVFADLNKLLKKVKNSKIKEHRLDCYSIDSLKTETQNFIFNIFRENNLVRPENVELFYPSQNYPSHKDDGGISYFIPLEEGDFTINETCYKVTPFVLYSFEDSKTHNTNFGSIMLK